VGSACRDHQVHHDCSGKYQHRKSPPQLISSQAQYKDLPPLISLIELALSPDIAELGPEGRKPSIFELHDDTDYDDLAFYVQVLAVAISNVPGYVQEEASQPVVVAPASPGKSSGEKPDTKLTLVRHAVENLHSRIGT
jgi:hypothetical protein